MRIVIIINKGGAFTLEVEPFNTIGELKAKILENEGFQICDQRLIYVGMCLEDTKILSDYNIQNDSKVYLLPRIKQ